MAAWMSLHSACTMGLCEMANPSGKPSRMILAQSQAPISNSASHSPSFWLLDFCTTHMNTVTRDNVTSHSPSFWLMDFCTQHINTVTEVSIVSHSSSFCTHHTRQALLQSPLLVVGLLHTAREHCLIGKYCFTQSQLLVDGLLHKACKHCCTGKHYFTHFQVLHKAHKHHHRGQHCIAQFQLLHTPHQASTASHSLSFWQGKYYWQRQIHYDTGKSHAQLGCAHSTVFRHFHEC